MVRRFADSVGGSVFDSSGTATVLHTLLDEISALRSMLGMLVVPSTDSDLGPRLLSEGSREVEGDPWAGVDTHWPDDPV